MWQENHVLQVEKFRIHRRFAIKDIQSGAGDGAGFQSLDKSLFIDKTTPGRVDDNGVLLQRVSRAALKIFTVEAVCGVLIEMISICRSI